MNITCVENIINIYLYAVTLLSLMWFYVSFVFDFSFKLNDDEMTKFNSFIYCRIGFQKFYVGSLFKALKYFLFYYLGKKKATISQPERM